jgi:hypothetical protein
VRGIERKRPGADTSVSAARTGACATTAGRWLMKAAEIYWWTGRKIGDSPLCPRGAEEQLALAGLECALGQSRLSPIFRDLRCL